MTRNKSIPLIKAICAIIYLNLSLFNSATAQPIEIVEPNGNSNSWLVSGHEIYVEISCTISRASFIPTKSCTKPHVVIKKKPTDSDISSGSLFKPDQNNYFNLVIGQISIGHKWMFDGNDDPLRKIPISDIGIGPQRSHELFTQMMSSPGTPLTFMTRSGTGAPIKIRNIILENFEARALEYVELTHHNFDQEQKTQRRNMFFALILIGSVAITTLWLFIILAKRGRTRLQKAKQQFEKNRVARIAEDEKIRTMVRSCVGNTGNSEIDTLQKQIKHALDAGDTETAEKLLSIINKINK